MIIKADRSTAQGMLLTAIVGLAGPGWGAAPQPAGADFSGVWELDRSANPPPAMPPGMPPPGSVPGAPPGAPKLPPGGLPGGPLGAPPAGGPSLSSRPATFDPDSSPWHQTAPLKPEWLAEFNKITQRKMSGMKIWDPAIRCLPPGMPHTMNLTYPMEILMTPGRVTVLTELFNETRRIWTDGRGHPPEDELEYTFVGDSVGHWKGDTLTIDTVGVREESVLDITALPHSDKMHLSEQVHLKDKNHLDWTITLDDPVVYSRPWTVHKHFVRSAPGEMVREYVCSENNHAEPYNASPDDAKYDHPDPRLKTRQ